MGSRQRHNVSGVPRRDFFNDPAAPVATSLVVAVTAVVLDNAGRLLLIRRTDNDQYSIPGGAQEIGETPAAAVRREVVEETGIDIDVTGLVGVFSDPSHVIAYDDGEVRQEFSVCFHARPIGGHARRSDESSEVLWADPTQLSDLPMHPSIRRRLDHALTSGPPFVE